MLKRFSIFLLVSSLFITMSCSMNDGDDINTLPPVDTAKYEKETTYEFPKGTPALDVYSCLYNKFKQDGEFNINGKYTLTESATLLGKPHTETITYDLTKLKLSRSHTEASNSFVTSLISDNKTFSYCYQWQHKNTNEWKNDRLTGLLIINK